MIITTLGRNLCQIVVFVLFGGFKFYHLEANVNITANVKIANVKMANINITEFESGCLKHKSCI